MRSGRRQRRHQSDYYRSGLGTCPQFRGIVVAVAVCRRGRYPIVAGRTEHAGRIGCQYHWHNHGYRDFQDYLDHLRSKRRKQVRRERREANASDVEIRVLSGS